MAKESTEEFDFEIADQEWQYDPLADAEDQEGSEQEEDPGDFTGKPIESLAGRPEDQTTKKDAKFEEPASQRIEELFEKLSARRRVLSGILRFLEAPKSAAELNGEVERLQKHDFSVYTAANYAELLEEAGAIIKVDENGTPFEGVYLAGDCCTGVLKHDDERSKFGEMPWAMASGWLSAGEMAEYLS